MILDWCAAQRETMFTLQQACGFCGFCLGVFDRLGFVENHKVKLDVLKVDRISSQRSIRRDYEIVVSEVFRVLAALRTSMRQNSQPGGESRCFLFPVED